jgi:hypothetical protein
LATISDAGGDFVNTPTRSIAGSMLARNTKGERRGGRQSAASKYVELPHILCHFEALK